MDVLSIKWIQRHMSLTKEVASWSKDPDTKVGALIIGSLGEPVSWGYNGIPMGVSDEPSRLLRPTKYHFMAHAERNAMDLSSRNSFNNCILFCTHSPCSGCATSIVNRKMGHIITMAENGFIDNSFVNRHNDSLLSHYAALEMITEAGIMYYEYEEQSKTIYQLQKHKGEKVYVRKIYA